MPNIREVARACGVSPMTVSFVLNNKPGQVSEQTRARVLQAIRELGYRPTALDRKLETHKTRTIGVVTGVEGRSLVTEGYHGTIFKWILAAAEETADDVLVFPHLRLHTDVERAIRTYCDGRCDGLIIIAPHYMSELLVALKERGFPFVGISHLGDDPDVFCVDVDNWQDAAKAVHYLYDQGHRKIGIVESKYNIPSSHQRREGFLRAMKRLNLPIEPETLWQYAGEPGEALNYARRLKLLPPGTRPTALFCWNDGSAYHWVEALQAVGLRVPEDISVIGFDDDAHCLQTTPLLTTLRQPYEEIGRQAVQLLLKKIEDVSLPPMTILLPAELVVRNSVKRIEV